MASDTPDKVVSSRLLTMPFMQRAIAREGASGSKSPITPVSVKKRKMDHTLSAAQSPTFNPFDQAALNAAISDGLKKRQTASEQQARDLGDSHWVLHHPSDVTKSALQKPLNILQVGFGQIDCDSSSSDNVLGDSDAETDRGATRLCFNIKDQRKKMNSESGNAPDKMSSSISESNSNSDVSSGSDTGSLNEEKIQKASRRRTILPSKRRAEQARAAQFAEKRRKKEVNLNRPTSISAGHRPNFEPANFSNMTCFSCGQKGHAKAKCPLARGTRSR